MSSSNNLGINKIKAEYKSEIQLENQKLELKNKALIEENNNLRGEVIEEINKNKLLIEKKNNLNKMIEKRLRK